VDELRAEKLVPPRLDDLYRMTTHIYGEQNAHRDRAATFAHFVEVCGMLTALERRKRRKSLDTTAALCKALGWFFPLLAKFRVSSVERLIYRKYPYACPYCRLTPHVDANCKTVRGTDPTVNHEALRRKHAENLRVMPASLDEWQTMFHEIYPRTTEDKPARSSLGLMEEIGELAEAIRVFEKHPEYFAGEAADVFSYLMGIANEHMLREQEQDRSFSLQAEFIRAFPGLCVQCGNKSCTCPSVPESTVGRTAKELKVEKDEKIFFDDPVAFSEQGRQAADMVLASIGGVSPVLTKLPIDRGETNSAMVVLCLRLAELTQTADGTLASRLQAAAMTIGKAHTYPGSPAQTLSLTAVLDAVRAGLAKVGQDDRRELTVGTELPQQMGRIVDGLRVLVAIASPADDTAARVSQEASAIDEAIKRSPNAKNIELRMLMNATADSIRRELREREFDVIHIGGHGTKEGPIVSSEEGFSALIPLDALRQLVSLYSRIRCVVLNGCYTLATNPAPIADVTIGMTGELDPDSAVDFARGFYDSVGAGMDYRRAYEEGRVAAAMKGKAAGLSPTILVRD
jgi:NTP pyrophosphatase (non-canonical NTP hydrolase)